MDVDLFGGVMVEKREQELCKPLTLQRSGHFEGRSWTVRLPHTRRCSYAFSEEQNVFARQGSCERR
jgi:hypothetical protein